MIGYRAPWVLPISGPPIRDGQIVVDDGRVVAVGPSNQRPPLAADSSASLNVRDLDSVVVLPGLVNAHTHLEFSYLRDAVPPAPNFVSWVRNVMAERRLRPDPNAPEIVDALRLAVHEAIDTGTAVVGDISNTLVSFAPLVESPLAAVLFYELIRFRAADAAALVDEACRALEGLGRSERVRVSLAAHAPYSVAPALLRSIRAAVDRQTSSPCSVHLAESAEETEFIRSGSGPWRTTLEDLGAWDPTWTAPGVSSVEFLDDCGFLDRRVLAVHGVQMESKDLERLASRGTTVVTCPRSNLHTGAGVPPIDAFYASGVRVALGTDSLASAPDLNLFAEMQAVRAIAPAVPAAKILASATTHGAHALGFGNDYGSIDAGKSGRLLAVRLPGGRLQSADVEEYLVSGVRAEHVRWVESC